MSERRPAPPDPRASLVDSGWSDAALSPERELPAYEDSAREHLVTRVDDQIQARIAAMNSDDRTEVVSSPLASSPLAAPPPSRPLPPLPPPLPPPPPSARRHSVPPGPLGPPKNPPPPLMSAPTDERTLVDSLPLQAELPPSQPPTLPQPVPGPLPPPSLPPPRPASLPPGASPSFAPMHSTAVSPFVPPPKLSEALLDRVQIGSSELPLWGVLAPAFAVTALLSALVAGILGPSGAPPPRVGTDVPAAVDGSAAPAAPSPSPSVERETTPRSGTGSPLDPARAGDAKALSAIEHQKPQNRTADEALALAAGKAAQTLASVGKLRARLAADPGLAKDPKVLADLRRFAQEPETSRDALAAMAAVPGALSADLLYETWTSTAERSQTTELAQSLLFSRDVRPKASPALAVALDLREAESCEDNAKILPRAIEVGDKRAFAPLSRLLRHNGCGPTKRDDCYACLREGELLKQALTTTKLRREPELVRREGVK